MSTSTLNVAAHRSETSLVESNAAAVPTDFSEPAAAEAARATDPHRCPKCEYDLHGLGAGQTACPECGIDITDAAREYRAMLEARKLSRARWLFYTSPVAVLPPFALIAFVFDGAAGFMTVCVMVWVWATAWLFLYREQGEKHPALIALQPFVAMLIGGVYCMFVWGCIIGLAIVISATAKQ